MHRDIFSPHRVPSNSSSRRAKTIPGFALGAALCLTLVSCGDESAPDGEPSPTAASASNTPSANAAEPSAESTVEPTPIPASSDGPAENWPTPEPPEAIYEPTEEGVEALLEYWFEANRYARETGDTEPLEEVSEASCLLCDQYIDLTEETFPTGWWVQDADTIHNTYVRMDGSTSASGLFMLDAGAFEAYWEGELHGETPATDGSGMSFASDFVDGQWRMTELMWVEPESN